MKPNIFLILFVLLLLPFGTCAADVGPGQSPLANLAQPSSPSGLPPLLGSLLPSQGNPSQGNPSQGNPSQGNPSQGNPSQGNPSQGNPSQSNPYYQANAHSNVFGASMFVGSFASQSGGLFNPAYLIQIGDNINVTFWGGFEFTATLAVDPQGNIFLPKVGPVHVLGTSNQQLQHTVEVAVGKMFRANVFSYASLAAAQPVRIFVGGAVNQPGLYNGTSMDSILHYIDLAGGINPAIGSFLDVEIKRNEVVRSDLNLYDFLLNGRIPLIQLSDGDIIFVGQRQSTVLVNGLAVNSKQFEFAGPAIRLADLISMAKIQPNVTNVRVLRNAGNTTNVDYYPIGQVNDVMVANGDQVVFTADQKPGTITVRVQGETLSPQEYVLPHGAKLGDVMSRIQYSDLSDRDSLQLFRLSVQVRQANMLAQSLKSLEATVLSASTASTGEAPLRAEDAALVLQWIDRAHQIQPTGQVYIASSDQRDSLPLEDGDVLNVPTRDNLVLVSGEVLFPNAVAFKAGLDSDIYIKESGGYTQSADKSRIVIAHLDGSFDDGNKSGSNIRSGDQILVLPKVDIKSRQLAMDLSTIIYQVAVAAKVAVGL
jgi:protein involved in polysaccharide export with SLBB domain